MEYIDEILFNPPWCLHQFCTKVTAGEGICLFQGSGPGPRSRHLRRCWPSREVPESSVALVTFKILPLEIGLHTINFTLLSSHGSETLVKRLRVVVRSSFSSSKPFPHVKCVQPKQTAIYKLWWLRKRVQFKQRECTIASSDSVPSQLVVFFFPFKPWFTSRSGINWPSLSG